jgi:ferrous iron transport protein B
MARGWREPGKRRSPITVIEQDSSNKVLLVGNPNVGKSVIFAYLTGTYTVVSNYPGTTVEVASGPARFDRSVEIVDTPGVTSLFPKSEDEKVTRDIILASRGATVVQVADAKNLFRALLLASELSELGCRSILALNMMDESRQRGISIDTRELSRLLGIEVIETVAVEKRGLVKIAHALSSGAARRASIAVRYPGPITSAVERIEGSFALPEQIGIFDIMTALTGDTSILEERGLIPQKEIRRLASIVGEMEGALPHPFGFYASSARRTSAESIFRQVAHTRVGERPERVSLSRRFALPFVLLVATVLLYAVFGRAGLARAGLHPTMVILFAVAMLSSLLGAERMNRITMQPILGLAVLAVVLFVVYELVGVFAAGTLVDLLEEGLFGRHIVPALNRLITARWLEEFLIGEFGLVSMGLNYSISIVLPIVTVFFVVFGVLEDTGYFPRLTVLTNNAFRVVGVNGKATLPVVLGFGCVTMATLASRILETKKERIIVITLLALAVPCSAQLGIMLAFASAMSIPAVLVIVGTIVVAYIVVGRVLSVLIPGEPSDFILELPPLRAPKVSNIVLKTWARVRWFLREAFPFFILATLILYILDKSGGLRIVYAAVRPVVTDFLGLPVETVQAFIIGFFRRDYGAAGLYKLWESGLLEGNQVVVTLLVMSLFLPCLATLIVIVKELGLRWALLILLLVTTVSILSGGLLNLVLNLTGIRL